MRPTVANVFVPEGQCETVGEMERVRPTVTTVRVIETETVGENVRRAVATVRVMETVGQ